MKSLLISVFMAGLSVNAAPAEKAPPSIYANKSYGTHFQTSDRCQACHNGLTTPTGEDISIGVSWRSSIMANSGRDPYWMASVRRETIDHPTATKLIHDECTICHMPMLNYEARLAKGEDNPFDHLPPDPDKIADRLSTDGVSCSVCHQITPDGLGTRESFVGQYKIDETTKKGLRAEFGPFEIDKGHTTVMRSSATYQPKQGKQIQSSDLCATCHTLLTKALDAKGNIVGELPEQVPYQEWQHSDYKDKKSCQSCHMPVVEQEVKITGVFGEPRAGFSRHVFVGGNFFMQRVLNRHREELSVVALPAEMDSAANRTIAYLQTDAAKILITKMQAANGRIQADVSVENLGGHKFPTAYPSRRAWLHITVKDRNGKVVFESGALNPDGSINGNDNDAEATRYEPHYPEITKPDQVQIFESIMVDSDSKPTTSLLTGLRYIKDNRLLPHGFDKNTADAQVAVVGDAKTDPDFNGNGDTVRYSVDTGNAQGPFTIDAELWYQPIGFRWAMNLKPYDAPEPKRWVSYYEESAAASGVLVAKASASR